MPRKPLPPGPTLFADADVAEPTNGAYGVAPARLSEDLGEPVMIVPETPLPPPPPGYPWYPIGPHAVRDRMLQIAAEVVGELRTADAARIAELEDAVRRAIGFHRQEMFETARTVLEGVVTLEPTL